MNTRNGFDVAPDDAAALSGMYFGEQNKNVQYSHDSYFDGAVNNHSAFQSNDPHNRQEAFIQQQQQQMTMMPVQMHQGGYFQPPDWACKYCGVYDPTYVVKCLETGFWFCNSSARTSASHIIHHLVKSKSKSIQLHKHSNLGDTVVECYNCSNRNLFMMGFIPAKGDNLVVLLCRNCLHIGALKELGWSMEGWIPLVQDRELVSWLVSVPDPELVALNAPRLSNIVANKLEDLWRKNPLATIDDLEKPGLDDDPDHVLKRYEDGYHYQRIFETLVKLEAEYDQEMKESLSEDNVSIRWKSGDVSRRVFAVFVFSAALSESLRITIGDELKLSLPSQNPHGHPSSSHSNTRKKPKGQWESTGTVVNIDDDEEITLEVRSSSNVPTTRTEGFHISFVWKPITFDRMQAALRTFAVDDKSVSGYLYHKLLGHDVEDQTLPVTQPENFQIPGLPSVNESQMTAIRQVLRRPLALIQGPPGTGKTVTCAALVYHLVRQNGPKDQVLVTAPSNVAVDQLAKKIEQTVVRVVRVAAKSREHLNSNVQNLNLHTMIQSIDSQQGKRLKELLEKKEKADNQLSNADLKDLVIIRKKLEKSVLRSAQVICCTCSGAGDPRISGLKFKQVLLDDSLNL